MNVYNRCVLPKLINFAMTRDEATRLRAMNIPAARGVVLEIGFGSGLNLPFYTGSVTHLYGVDTSAELLAIGREKIAGAAFPVDLFNCDADRIPLPDASVDTVVVTWSLCSIANVEEALRDMRRVLKPGGSFIFVEHGLSPDPSVGKWQHRMTPFWRVFAGGCHLNRKIDDLVRAAGFSIEHLRTAYALGPRALAFMYEGRARRTNSDERITDAPPGVA